MCTVTFSMRVCCKEGMVFCVRNIEREREKERALNRLLRLKHGSLIRRFASEEGRTPLQDAVLRGDMEIVELLLERGAKPSIRNDLGRDVLS